MIEADILRRLRFDTMTHREERMPNAYQTTFEWVFHQPPKVNGQQTFDNYGEWLKGDEALYWITGKPGAGKSTLTKHLFNEPRTIRSAEAWSQQKQLICAGFFFWNSRMEIQMSKEGLMRTLLFQLINHVRASIPTVFKESWENYELWGGDAKEWDWEDLVKSFKALISDQTRSYLLFIDGLDEFAGDHTNLVNLILDISRHPNVKLCVASRPWLAFEEAFGRRPRLKMESLTKNDIERFVSDKLLASQRFLELQRDEPTDADFLINEITGKAQGVFLWVYLVVRSVRDGLRDGDSMRELRNRISSLPSDLEELFQKILSRLDTTYFRQASILFQLMDAAVPKPLTVLCVAFAEEHFEFAMAKSVQQLNDSQRASRAETVRRRLNSRSKGLIEATPVTVDPHRAQVQYLHRTVKDFFARKDIWQYILSGTDESFDPSVTLCGVYVLHLKTMNTTICASSGSLDTHVLEDLWGAVRGCLDHGSRAEGILPGGQPAYFDEMNRTVEVLFEECKKVSGKDFNMSHWTDSCQQVLDNDTEGKAWVNSNPCTSFFEYALHRELNHYVESKVSTGAFATEHRLKDKSLLYRAIQNNNGRLIEFLLQRNASPNTPALDDKLATPWQELLRQVDGSYRKDTKKWFDLVQLFLDRGADPEAIVYSTWKRDRKKGARTQASHQCRAYAILATSFGVWAFERTKELLNCVVTVPSVSFHCKQWLQRVKSQKEPDLVLLKAFDAGAWPNVYRVPNWALQPQR